MSVCVEIYLFICLYATEFLKGANIANEVNNLVLQHGGVIGLVVGLVALAVFKSDLFGHHSIESKFEGKLTKLDEGVAGEIRVKIMIFKMQNNCQQCIFYFLCFVFCYKK